MDKYVERIFKKISLKLNTAFHNNTSWYTDTDGFLEYSLIRESRYYKEPALQEIIPFWGIAPQILNIYGLKFKNCLNHFSFSISN